MKPSTTGIKIFVLLLVFSTNTHGQLISMSCSNYPTITKLTQKWSYWCYGGGRSWGFDAMCDCARTLYYAEARLKCERTATGKNYVQNMISSAITRSHRISADRAKASFGGAPINFPWRCRCNGVSCPAPCAPC